MTGRYPLRLGDGGMKKFNANLPGHEVTIAEFLKQGCHEDHDRLCIDEYARTGAGAFEPCRCFLGDQQECNTLRSTSACYTTAFFGKWNIGRKGGAPNLQGFDEFVSLKYNRAFPKNDGKARRMLCSPNTNRFCRNTATGALTGKLCTTDTDCDNPGVEHCPRAFGAGAREGEPAEPAFGINQAGFDNPAGHANDYEHYGLYLGDDLTEATSCGEFDDTKAPLQNVHCCAPDGSRRHKFSGFAKADRYDMTLHTDSSGNPLFGKKRVSDTPSCNLEGHYADTKCGFFLGMVRDLANSFIRRQARYAEKFFMYLAVTQLHFPLDASARVLEHYKIGLGKANKDPHAIDKKEVKLLAAAEELDAAIGAIVETLQDPQVDLYDETAIIFTSDHGQQREYGNPNLNGGKQSRLEGGVRVGGLLHLPGLASSQSPIMPDEGKFFGEQVVSQLDIFPTVAHLAGFQSPAFDTTLGRVAPLYAWKQRNFKPWLDPLVFGAECTRAATPTPGDNCLGHEVDGRSFLNVVADPAYNPATQHHRDFAFAFEDKDKGTTKSSITSRKGYFADKVVNDKDCSEDTTCGYAAGVCGYIGDLKPKKCSATSEPMEIGTTCTDDADCAADPLNVLDGDRCEEHLVRTVRGGSIVVCPPAFGGGVGGPADTACESEECRVLSGLCMTTTEKNDCGNASLVSLCDAKDFPRCQADDDCVVAGRSCQFDVYVPCNGCYETSWKYGRDDSLYDVTTNIEEFGAGKNVAPADKVLDAGDSDPISCPVPTSCNPRPDESPAALSANSPLCNVQRYLNCGLEAWHDCVGGGDTNSHLNCDDEAYPAP